VILFSWIYEITPEGIKKDSEVAPEESISSTTGRKISIATVLLLLAIAVLTFLRPQTGSSVPVSTAPPASYLPPASSSLARGVAVLPFENISQEQENAYFASGVQEDILTHLSSIKDLRVISRTSVKSFTDTELRIPQIAEVLGVTHIVEGSVRRSGDRVRVTVQLIDGSSDEHIWAKNYDRTLDDIFAIQSEVAQKIVGVIKQKLTTEDKALLGVKPTLNPKASELYHRAMASFDAGVRSTNTTTEPIRLMQLATQEDPNYLQAWLKLEEYCSYAVWWEAIEYESCAKRALERIALLKPDSAELQLAEGIYFYRIERDYEKSYNKLKQATRGLPNNLQAWTYLGFVARRLNHWQLAKDATLKVTELDPLDENARVQRVITLEFSGDWQAAIAEAEESVAKFPAMSIIAYELADLKRQYLGQMANYPAILQGLPAKLRWNHGNPFISGAFSNDEQRIAWIKSYSETTSAGAPARTNGELGELALLRGDEELSQQYLQAGYALWKQNAPKLETQSPFMLALTTETRALAKNHVGAREVLKMYFKELRLHPDEMVRNETGMSLVTAYIALNEPELAWAEVKRMLASGSALTPWDLQQDLRLIHYFGDLPEYQNLTKDLVIGSYPSAAR
jgi:TolB-like protein